MVSIESKLKEIRMVGLVEVRRRKGRVVGFLKLQEPSSGTQLAARRHTRDVHGVLFTKNVFRTFRGTGTARRLFFTARRNHFFLVCAAQPFFSGLRSFCKTVILDSLTIRFR